MPSSVLKTDVSDVQPTNTIYRLTQPAGSYLFANAKDVETEEFERVVTINIRGPIL
ncbi:hypothetical protein CH63R_07288 [Colletotrichum higginsianum IMI 349063]|uniref:Uncharacterized protein n=1 Tax=Colletotrichum higginsianum (strain IMI 349063) TaxID=759273 RepID=A0A1B7Y8W5_COLHI|nr:hypothetical protein CH63R_07288 [Colletotrichum higginsianum IMI 349063]OBR08523.1 hypothetical protein CH63R_07288 [Colletotrichum higginsianum IMI 349063]